MVGPVAKRCACAVVAAVTLIAAPALAGVKTYAPEKFQVTTGQDTWAKQPLGLQNGVFWTPVKLRVGSRITGLVFYHWGYSDSSSMTSVYLNRVKLGAAWPLEDILLSGTDGTYAGMTVAVPPTEVTVTEPFTQASDLVIRPGYRYYLLVVSSSTTVSGVRVYYDAP
jgi:hypothetical protein